MSKSLFLSYVHEDKAHRDDVIAWAKAGKLGQGYATVVEADDVRQLGEAAIESHLRPRIQGCAALIALIGKDTHNHEWVRREIEIATSLNKRVLLVRVPGTTGVAPRGFTDRTIHPLNPESLAKVLAG